MIEEYDGSGIGSELLALRYYLMFSWAAVNNAQAENDHEALEELQADHEELYGEFLELLAESEDHGVGCGLVVTDDGYIHSEQGKESG